MGVMSSLFSMSNSGAVRIEDAAFALVFAFVLGQGMAWVYMHTHSGLSYSRAFVQSIILLTVIVSLGMLIIGNNIVMAFGLIGALAVIRFRNILKDTRDTSFIFCSLVIGIACGTRMFQLAILGAVVFSGLAVYLHWADFGSRHVTGGYLRFQIATAGLDTVALETIIGRHCKRMVLMNQRMGQETGEMAWRVVMRDPSRSGRLIAELQGYPGISQLSFVQQEEEAEI